MSKKKKNVMTKSVKIMSRWNNNNNNIITIMIIIINNK